LYCLTCHILTVVCHYDKMKSKSIILLIVVLLVFFRTYFESFLIQLGLNNKEYYFLHEKGLVSDFLKFKYQAILDILSLLAYFLLAKYLLKDSTKRGLVTSGVFVVTFMFTDFYKILGTLFGYLIPDSLMIKLEMDSSLYWSIDMFLGMNISVIIMALLAEKIKNEHTTRAKTSG